MENTQEFKLLRPGEVAELLRVSRSEVYRLIALGRIPAVRLSERVVRIPLHALQAYIEERLEGGAG